MSKTKPKKPIPKPQQEGRPEEIPPGGWRANELVMVDTIFVHNLKNTSIYFVKSIPHCI